MKFKVVLAVKDVRAARAFYETLLGLTVVDDYGLCVMFDCGLSLQQNFGWLTGLVESEIKVKENNCEVYFEELHFDGLVEKIKTWPGIRLLHDVLEHSWGQRVIRFYDLDEHLIEVGENMKAVTGRLLSQGMAVADISEKMDIETESVQRILEMPDE